jgi:5-methylcytosine-specific restriction protein A
MASTKGQGNPDWTREETILALELLVNSEMRAPSKTSPQVRSLSEFLRSCQIHPPESRNTKFRNPDGVYMKMQNLLSCDLPRGKTGLVTTKMDRAVWAEFQGRDEELRKSAAAIRGAQSSLNVLEELEQSDDDDAVDEGGIINRVHRRRERARGLRAKVIARNRKANGKLKCECCNSRERHSLGAAAESEFEAHHKIPLSAPGNGKTRPSDLALLCANCHRLIHGLMRVQKSHVAIADLRAVLRVAQG